MLSDKPFINPSAWPTGPVVSSAEQEVHIKTVETKTKKKGHKSSKGDKAKHDKVSKAIDTAATASDIPRPGDDLQEPIFQLVQSSSHSTAGQERKSTGSSDQYTLCSASTGQEKKVTGCMEQDIFPPGSAASSFGFTGAGALSYSNGQEYRVLLDQNVSDSDFSGDEYSNIEDERFLRIT